MKKACGCCGRPFRKRDTTRDTHPGTVLMYAHGLCFGCKTCEDRCKILARTSRDPQWLTLCRWVPAGETWVPELVTGLRRGRQRGPWRLLVDGRVRSFPRSEWMEVIEGMADEEEGDEA